MADSNEAKETPVSAKLSPTVREVCQDFVAWVFVFPPILYVLVSGIEPIETEETEKQKYGNEKKQSSKAWRQSDSIGFQSGKNFPLQQS